jgi:hypothetical protein
MAFSTSNVQSGRIFGGVNIYCGDWSGTAGDAPGTITLGGGRVYLAEFRNEDTGSPQEYPDSSVSVLNGVITMSVYNHQTVSNGRFFIVYG